MSKIKEVTGRGGRNRRNLSGSDLDPNWIEFQRKREEREICEGKIFCISKLNENNRFSLYLY